MIWQKKAQTEINSNGSKQNEAKFVRFPLDFLSTWAVKNNPTMISHDFQIIFLVKLKYAIFREESPEL